jgi:hypothetical protein
MRDNRVHPLALKLFKRTLQDKLSSLQNQEETTTMNVEKKKDEDEGKLLISNKFNMDADDRSSSVKYSNEFEALRGE